MIKTKTLRQKISLKASAHDVYDALMDSKKHAKFTGGPAKISRRVGGIFSVYDGYATGKNLELITDRMIVQTWRAADWDEGDISEVTFLIVPSKTGCILNFTHKNIPIRHISAIRQGWKDFYWGPMKNMLENR